MANKIHKSIGILKALQPKLPISSLHICFITLLFTLICNTATLPGHPSTTHWLKEYLYYKKGITHCLQKPWGAHTQQLFKLLHTLKITDINKHHTCCFMYKAIHDQLPHFFTGYFKLNKDVHHYSTRQSQHVHLTNIRTTKRKFTIKNHGPSLWNSLPDFLKDKPSFHTFKYSYKEFILSQY